MKARAHDDADRRYLEQAIGRMESKLNEKGQREQAEVAEESRLEEMAERARGALLAERVDEKEVLGAEILDKVRQLGRDRLIRKFRRFTGDGWGGFVPIHEREITNVAELRPGMPTDRHVEEIFQLSSGGVLYYNQVYEALHFAEGMLQAHVRSDPPRFGVKLGRPADFRSLSFASVEAFLGALSGGEPYRVAAQKITRLLEEEE